MAKQTTRDAALSRLFGNAPADSGEAHEASGRGEVENAGGLARSSDAPRRDDNREPSAVDAGGRGRGEAREAATISQPETGQSTSGYIGMGRYSRADGIVERITPYVRPDQAEALRIAVARKNDPRGTDVSQIIQSLLDEAGYHG